MNYLAHLHVASCCQSQLLGNLLADFVRGKPDGRFQPQTVDGIYLHRYVDGYIDALDDIKVCRALFPPELYRYSAIALDIFWDHALVTHWETFHDAPLELFVKQAESDCQQASDLEPSPLPERFAFMSEKMWREQWIQSYADINTLPFVLKRMSTRSPRMAPLADTAEVLIAHQVQLLDAFPSIYQQVLNAASTFSEIQQSNTKG
ncbi:ACP phosphodiesterase [Enterovibrio norvegicus FF-162]|uniref:acyl carrier protein phosphodiesterase n=1 Tax=Enterovibrio norvegicus TaxID=188144 RepID=UPI0002DA7698|nr:ACP phosphodiesterase [Enterovibrio norvegicus]OEE88003.1 ACP phosphodiesterase [Enterovibrio norvegicus FF-162]